MAKKSSHSTTQLSTSIRPWSRYLYRLVAAEISLFTKYFDRVIQLQPMPHDNMLLFNQIVGPEKEVIEHSSSIPDLSLESQRRSAILLNGTFNYSEDIQGTLQELHPHISPTTRIVAVGYNPYWAWLYKIANFLKLRSAPPPTTFVTMASLSHLAKISGYEIVRSRYVGFSPFKLFGLGSLLNSLLSALPFVRKFSLAMVIVLRPIKVRQSEMLSIVVPARNEKGNIEGAITRLPQFGQKVEVIFVEGNSSDNTWEEILRVQQKYQSPALLIQAHQQSGKGKNDAVRLGFSKATGDVLTILDADLTMPPEMLDRFLEAWKSGHAEFINGSRLVYSMQDEAMRPLNLLGNIFFSKAISMVLGIRLSDTLCGTKLLAKHDYQRLVRWRQDFGDFDPFGDFELLFAASVLCLGNADIPIRYLARTYGTTNISRFSHGFMLLRMTIIGFFKVRVGSWI